MQIKTTPLRAIPSGSQKLRPSLGPGLVWTASTPTVIRSRRAAFVGTATNPIYGGGAGGKSATWTDGASALTGLVVPAQLLPAVNGLTLVLWAKPVSEAQMRFAFSQKVAGPFVPQISLGVNAGDSFTSQAGSLDLWIRDTSANTMNVRATGQIDSGLHCWVVRSNRSGGAIWRDGVAQTLATNNALTGGVYFDSTAVTCIGNLYNSDFATRFSYPLFLFAGFASALPDGECIRISRNPLTLFQPVRTWLPVSAGGVTIYRPNSDVAVSGWVPSTGATVYGVLDEPTLDDADYATSPDLSTPATMGLTASLAAGTWTVRVRGLKTDTAGQLRINLLDGSNAVQGSSAWQALTAIYTTYSLPVTTTGTATRVQIEVAP